MANDDAQRLFAKFIEALGGDASDPRLADTPATVAAFLRGFVAPRELPSVSLFPVESDGVVELRDLRFYSMCEHHVVPFFGTIDVAYVPDGRVAGFGGIERGILHFARRLQLQERMTCEIADWLEERLQPKGLRVVSKARQMCLEMSGGSPETVITVRIQRGVLAAS